MRKRVLAAAAIAPAFSIAMTSASFAQAPPPDYGAPINAEQARVAAAAAIAEMKKNGWKMAVTVVEPSGALVHFERVDGTQYASLTIAQKKAQAAATFKRPTKAFQDGLAKGNTYLMTLTGVIASEGGIPVIVGGKIIGAVGCSGGTGAQDGQACAAGVAAVK
jgi:glc operon protein GlcG